MKTLNYNPMDKSTVNKEKNGVLSASKNRKIEGGNNEFYTPLKFIEDELEKHYEYREQFKNKVIYCNCDDPFWSKFYEFFKLRAVTWELKGLIVTSYKPNGGALKLEWYRNVDNIVSDNTIMPRISMLNGDGDFRSEECIDLLKKCDIVVTNPPFSSESSRSIYAEFIDCILKYNKQFVIIGNHVKMLNNKILENIVDEKINIGYEFYDVNFHTIIKCDTDEPRIRRQKVCWFTNLELKKENELLKFKRCYKDNEKLYPKYKDYDIIFVDKYENIPSDYMGIMSVPITFLGKYNKKQFRLVCINGSNLPVIKDSKDSILEDGRSVFAHLLIQRKDVMYNAKQHQEMEMNIMKSKKKIEVRSVNQEIEVNDSKISDTVLKRKCNNLIDTLNTVMNQSIDRFDSYFKEVKFNIDIYDDTYYFFEKYIDECYNCLIDNPLSMKHILSLFKVKKEDDIVNQIKHCFIDEIERQINIMEDVYCNNHSIAIFFNTMYLINPSVFIKLFNDYEFGLGTQRILQEYICKLDCDTYFNDTILDKLGIMCYDYKYIRKEDITLYDGSVELLDFSGYE